MFGAKRIIRYVEALENFGYILLPHGQFQAKDIEGFLTDFPATQRNCSSIL